MSLNFRDVIYRLIKDIAIKLRDEGSKLNDSIAKEFISLAEDLGARTAVEKYWLAAVIGGTWAIGGMDRKDRIRYIKQVYQLTKDPTRRRDPMLVRDVVYMKGYRGSRKINMERMLTFHAKVLENYDAQDIINNPPYYQRLIIDEAERTPNVRHWTAVVPFKILAVSGVLLSKFINELEPPLGVNVVKGIKFLTGFQVDASRKIDRKFMLDLHRHLANLADTDIFTINSGLWKLGEQLSER
ncbi:MAG: hypothetical protein DRN15_07215 [Thermoprotei archaeon]|nr:MAG: hypothetical protein DRN15_07215 [Thermoprotei archaeon]